MKKVVKLKPINQLIYPRLLQEAGYCVILSQSVDNTYGYTLFPYRTGDFDKDVLTDSTGLTRPFCLLHLPFPLCFQFTVIRALF